MGSEYIWTCISQNKVTPIYLYLYLPKNVYPNIFVFVFEPENRICHTMAGSLKFREFFWGEAGHQIILFVFDDV